ncbi:glutathione transferase fungal specific class A [Moniliophthora roreri]|uniref:GST N-terminal domain-containing protein n=1 Tax=Moniliophthora roreri TaxID=221103 RepID=A0A0W0FQ51_MONRR|nr:glutathione transferase fungal specific class A [Moniliophthora roreri]
MPNPIRYYDIPSKLGKAWSPNTLKTMYTLNYKGIPYELVWVEYPDIENLCKSIGASATSTKADGRPHYTLPAIHDPNTGISIADSIKVAEYLDKTYPGKPVIPPGTASLHKAFADAFIAKIYPSLLQVTMPRTANNLNPSSEEYFRRTKAARFGKALTEVDPKGEKRVEFWKQIETAYGTLDGWMKKEDQYVMGDTVSFADFVIAASLLWIRVLWGEDSEEWKSVASWHDGRWGRLIKSLTPYEKLVA